MILKVFPRGLYHLVLRKESLTDGNPASRSVTPSVMYDANVHFIPVENNLEVTVIRDPQNNHSTKKPRRVVPGGEPTARLPHPAKNGTRLGVDHTVIAQVEISLAEGVRSSCELVPYVGCLLLDVLTCLDIDGTVDTTVVILIPDVRPELIRVHQFLYSLQRLILGRKLTNERPTYDTNGGTRTKMSTVRHHVVFILRCAHVGVVELSVPEACSVSVAGESKVVPGLSLVVPGGIIGRFQKLSVVLLKLLAVSHRLLQGFGRDVIEGEGIERLMLVITRGCPHQGFQVRTGEVIGLGPALHSLK